MNDILRGIVDSLQPGDHIEADFIINGKRWTWEGILVAGTGRRLSMNDSLVPEDRRNPEASRNGGGVRYHNGDPAACLAAVRMKSRAS